MHINKKPKVALTAEQLAEIEQEQKKLSASTERKKPGRKVKWKDATALVIQMNPHSVDYMDNVVMPELRSIWAESDNYTYASRNDVISYLVGLWQTYDKNMLPEVKATALESRIITLNIMIKTETFKVISHTIIPAIEQKFWASGERGRVSRRMMLEYLLTCHQQFRSQG
ncbi:hypothetical protein PVA45_08295 (plasmid) [Entomospira entomophila]|uniref:Uncharacterized protein n=1 Tax=Entomospira entomophila TaxID=2719988 RepID=A0A968GBL6_9SPIO|nr:hypothetical protein [Entomospira entomophilus]NIZ41542.1 hypothetical protein [Entomospira entomophilus]WDI36430.1 hypothetical protein PVA45_08295 [Entomospira entomophilus]